MRRAETKRPCTMQLKSSQTASKMLLITWALREDFPLICDLLFAASAAQRLQLRVRLAQRIGCPFRFSFAVAASGNRFR